MKKVFGFYQEGSKHWGHCNVACFKQGLISRGVALPAVTTTEIRETETPQTATTPLTPIEKSRLLNNLLETVHILFNLNLAQN